MNKYNPTLDSLGRDFGTDKCSWGHDYLRFYEQAFQAFRDRDIKILEVGVAGGGSLKVWESFFKKVTVIGADIDPTATRFARPGTLIEIVDQSNSEDLLRLGRTHGPFDIVIEDGSHMWSHQILTLQTIFSFVKEGGIYIVEDLQTNYGRMQIDYRGTSTISCVEYLKKIVDIRVADIHVDLSFEDDEFLRTSGRQVDSITFYKESCLIRKKVPVTLDEPLEFIQHDEAAKCLSLGAHIGCYGTRYSPSAVIRGGREGQNIQAFIITCKDPLLHKEFTYRARSADGTWTEWTECGALVGTIGKSQDLTGFSVRLAPHSTYQFSVTLIGAFRDSASNVIAGNGEACIPTTPGSALWAMQVAIVRL